MRDALAKNLGYSLGTVERGEGTSSSTYSMCINLLQSLFTSKWLYIYEKPSYKSPVKLIETFTPRNLGVWNFINWKFQFMKFHIPSCNSTPHLPELVLWYWQRSAMSLKIETWTLSLLEIVVFKYVHNNCHIRRIWRASGPTMQSPRVVMSS